MKKTIILALALVLATTLILGTSCENNGNHTDTDNVNSDDTLTTDSDSSSVSDDLTSSDGADDLIPDEPIDEKVVAKVDALLETKHRLEYNEDGSFRVLILADLHMQTTKSESSVQTVKDNIKQMVDRVNPDLVIFTGDNTICSGTEKQLRSNIDAIVGYIEENKIPWCHVYGNHDHERALTHARQQAIYESYEYCISKSVDGLSSVGNYVHAVYNADGTIGSVIYLINSGTYDDEKGGYAYIQDDQIAWYKETSELLQTYNRGNVIKGMMAFHIPLVENSVANENRDNKELVSKYTGAANEEICCSKTDNNLFETAVERGDIKLIVTGHDHKNDYMFNYNGIKLTSSPNLSGLTYTDIGVQGARVIDLNARSLDNVKTYVEYMIERLDASEFEPIGSNVDLKITDESITNCIKTDWNGKTLSGTVVTTVVKGKGPDGESAIKIVRDSKENFELRFEVDNKGTLGNNKYLVVWMDLTEVEFRKSCFGIVTEMGLGNPYRTDDHDEKSPFYYLADGSDKWETLSHGKDGCFGAGDSGSQSIKGKKGYFAIPLEYVIKGTSELNSSSVVAYVYFYCSLDASYVGNPIYMSDFKLVEDYKTFNS